jgi:hypothetical protein
MLDEENKLCSSSPRAFLIHSEVSFFFLLLWVYTLFSAFCCHVGYLKNECLEFHLLTEHKAKWKITYTIITPTKCTLLLLKAPDITICTFCLIFCP